MKLALVALALTATIALPAVAEAKTTRAELRHDQRIVHRQQHQLNHAVRHHNWDRARIERHQLAEAREELREDTRDFIRERR
jgi:ribonuclease HI